MSRPQDAIPKLSRGESVEVAQKDGESASGEALPEGWAAALFSDICKVQGGFAFKSKTYVDEGIALIRIGDLEDGEVTINGDTVRLPTDFLEVHSNFRLRMGDVLMAMSGATTGKMAEFQSDEPALLNQRVGRFVAHDSELVSQDFLRLQVARIADEVRERAYGGAQPNISPTAIEATPIQLPPKAEQSRIVSAIESLQERSSRARVLLSEVGPLIGQLRQSVLRDAFSGKLTADWRARRRMGTPESPKGRESFSDERPTVVKNRASEKDSRPSPSEGLGAQATNPAQETASELLLRIRTERRERWQSEQLAKYEAKGKQPPKNWQDKYKEPEPVDESELPELPDGWCWIYLPEVGYMNRGKSRHRPRNAEHLYGGPYPFVQTGDIAQSDGRIESHKQTYSEAGLEQSRLWPAGTVGITIAANIASTAVLTYPACFPDSVVGVIPAAEICSPEYVEFFIRTAKEDLERYAPSTAQKNINLGTLSNLAIPIPPRDESDELVRLVMEGLEIAKSVGDSVASMESSLTQLDQSILSKAFRGELVPQDPRDEPASELLARIRTTRETTAKAAKKKTTKKGTPKPKTNSDA